MLCDAGTSAPLTSPRPTPSQPSMDTVINERSAAPLRCSMPRNYADAGIYHPQADGAFPRAPGVFFARKGGTRPPSTDKDFWRVARTVTRSAYLLTPDVPGPGAHNPRLTTFGRPSAMATPARAAAQRSGTSGTAHGKLVSSWPQSPPPTQLRRRTLGDGTSMLVPVPRLEAPEPPVFVGRETAIVKQHRNLCAQRDYAALTTNMMIGARKETWNADLGPAARLPPRVAQVPDSAWWFLSPGELLGSKPNSAA